MSNNTDLRETEFEVGESTVVYVRFEVFTAVMWRCVDVNRRFGGKYRLHFQGRKIRKREGAATCSHWFLARGFSTLKMETIRSSETSVHARCTQRHIPEVGILEL
jgi:hypothetical protein